MDIGCVSHLGLYFCQFDWKTNTIQNYTNENSDLSNNNVLDIAGDEKGNLWLATQLGLNKFNKKTKTFKFFTADNNGFCGFLLELHGGIAGEYLSQTGRPGFFLFAPNNRSYMLVIQLFELFALE